MEDNYEDRILFLKIWKAIKEKKRDIGLEQEILTKGDPAAACLYAINVIKGEWEAAENIIGKAVAFSSYKNRSTHLPKFPNASGKLVVRPKSKRWSEISIDVSTLDLNHMSGKLLHLSSLVANSYLRLTGKRLKSTEENTKTELTHRWNVARVMGYVKLVYEKTGEIVDFDNGMVAVQIIEAIKKNVYMLFHNFKKRIHHFHIYCVGHLSDMDVIDAFNKPSILL
jgi:hypothetical protein